MKRFFPPGERVDVAGAVRGFVESLGDFLSEAPESPFEPGDVALVEGHLHRGLSLIGPVLRDLFGHGGLAHAGELRDAFLRPAEACEHLDHFGPQSAHRLPCTDDLVHVGQDPLHAYRPRA
ncbi:hypothetical protein [[Kitasatospora] papulosa]|uniref:hypothetical protein n=1 Tax=[Kitasatospora] papulosa TaxID=1464011 RepID=UPI0036AEA158